MTDTPNARKNAAQSTRSWRQGFRSAEAFVITTALLLMMLVPIANAVMRKIFGSGFAGASVVTQSLVLIVSMLGGALAAREGRLLSLSTIRALVTGRWKSAILVFSNGFAIVVSAFGGPEVEKRVGHLGAKAYFQKPFDVERLKTAVSTVLAGDRAASSSTSN